MKKHLGELRVIGEETAKYRGHSIEWSPPYHGESNSVQSGACTKCGMEVHINMNPRPNDIDIGGEAVALNCGDNDGH
jgi:hypothetical protein